MQEQKSDRLQLRLEKEFKKDIKIQSLKKGFNCVSEYIFDLIKKDMEDSK